MSSKDRRFSLTLLTLAIAVFMIVSGILALANYDSPVNEMTRALNSMFGGSSQTMLLIIAIAQLIFGVLLLLDLFSVIKAGTMSLIKFIIFLGWAVVLVINHFLNGFPPGDWLVWLRPFSLDLVILAALWAIREYES